MLQTLSQITDVHFKFNSVRSDDIDENVVGECRGGDGVVLRGARGMTRAEGVRYARGLLEGLGLRVQLRPGMRYEWMGGGEMDVMLVREVGGGAMGLRESGEESDGSVGFEGVEGISSEVRYEKADVDVVVDWAVRIAGMRGGRLCNVDKADVMKVSRFWRWVVHNRFEKVRVNEDSVTLNDMFVDDFAREVILNPTRFDVVVTSNLFGDVLNEVIGALSGPARIAPAAWLAADGTAVYGPADVYNPSAYVDGRNGAAKEGKVKSTAANLIAMYRAASMLLRYSFEEPGTADMIQNAINKVMVHLTGGQRGIQRDEVDLDDRIMMNGDDEDHQGDSIAKSVDSIDGDVFEKEFIKQINYIRQYEQVCDPLECGE